MVVTLADSPRRHRIHNEMDGCGIDDAGGIEFPLKL
jgi:hypothetical protein